MEGKKEEEKKKGRSKGRAEKEMIFPAGAFLASSEKI